MRRKCLNRIVIGILVTAVLLQSFSWSGGIIKSYAASGTRQDLLSIASSQVGYHEKASNANLDDYNANSGSANYTKYARDLGVQNGQPWCAYFIWWCMQSAGVEKANYPSVGYATKNWFSSRGLWHGRDYTPVAGDYIAFGNGPDHCGIVEYVASGKVHTIEGNSSDQVCRREYALGNSYIMGYGTINYKDSAVPVASDDNPGAPYPIPSGILKSGSRGDSVKWVQQGLNEVIGAQLVVDGIYGNGTTYAVKVYQQNHGLSVDGIIGNNTTNSLKSEWLKKKDTTKPTISNVLISEVSLDGYRVTCNVSDDKGIKAVRFPAWTAKNEQDDIIWHEVPVNNGVASYYIKASDHKNGKGTYRTHIYAYDTADNSTCYPAPDVNLSQFGSQQDVGNGFYATIANNKSNTVLQDNGKNVCAYKETGADKQLWFFEKQSDGTYKITNKNSGKCLDYYGGVDDPNTNVFAYDCNNTNAQRWKLYSAGNEAYFIQGKICEDTLLSLKNGSSSDDTDILLETVTKAENQKFRIQKYYKVTFKNGDEVVKTVMVKAGQNADAPELTRDGYELSWDNELKNISHDVILNAVWTKKVEVTTEEPVVEVPTTETPTAEDTKAEEPTTQEPDTSISTTEEIKKENPTTQEPAANIPPTEKTEKENSTTESPVPDVPGNSQDNDQKIPTGLPSVSQNDSYTNDDCELDDSAQDNVNVKRARIKLCRAVRGRKLRVILEKNQNVDGYEIVVGFGSKKRVKKFKKAIRTQDYVDINGFETLEVGNHYKMISGLKKGKTYYIAVRAFIDTGDDVVYGDYSKIKRVKIRR